jgi:F-type H+-transporting ATPase subunit alpha
LDAATKAVLDKGSRNVEILKQPQYSPMKVEEQIAILYCGTKGLLQKVPVNKVKDFELEFLHHMQISHSDVLSSLKSGNLSDNDVKTLEQTAKEIIKKYEI